MEVHSTVFMNKCTVVLDFPPIFKRIMLQCRLRSDLLWDDTAAPDHHLDHLRVLPLVTFTQKAAYADWYAHQDHDNEEGCEDHHY